MLSSRITKKSGPKPERKQSCYEVHTGGGAECSSEFDFTGVGRLSLWGSDPVRPAPCRLHRCLLPPVPQELFVLGTGDVFENGDTNSQFSPDCLYGGDFDEANSTNS